MSISAALREKHLNERDVREKSYCEWDEVNNARGRFLICPFMKYEYGCHWRGMVWVGSVARMG